jgi:hypothetical protein
MARFVAATALMLGTGVWISGWGDRLGAADAVRREPHASGADRALIVLQHGDLAPRLTATNPREVLWRVAPGDPSPFGFIPTGWNTQPELLPLTWDVQTVFARRPPAFRGN